MSERLLVVGNKNYSSWSLRGWIGLTMAGVPFDERVILLDRPETHAEILAVSAAGLVPVLIDGGLTVNDTMAILEYANEVYAEGRLWPAEVDLRARARSVSAEMHAGFPNIRQRMPMNLARPVSPLPPKWAVDAATQAELERLLGLWDGLLAEHGGPFLFGTDWSNADAMYVPMATRLRTYAIDLNAWPRCSAYVAHLLGLPAFRQWEAAALAEPPDAMPTFAYER